MALIVPAIMATTVAQRNTFLRLLPETVDVLSLDLIDGTLCPGQTLLDPDPELTTHATGLIELDIMSAFPLGIVRAWAGRPQVVRAIVHAEIDGDVRGVLEEICGAGMDAGVALMPETSVEAYEHLYNACQVVLIRGNTPGKSGQDMLPSTIQKVATLHAQHPELLIEVDIGVNALTIPALVEAGASLLAVNSAIFGMNNPIEAFEELQAIAWRP
jgi:ribulose-phosphate 3-epimerase